MGVSIHFLGPLSELAGKDSCEVDAPLNWTGLIEAVGPAVAEQLQTKRVHIACAGRVLSEKSALNAQDGDEVALLPPVSGG